MLALAAWVRIPTLPALILPLAKLPEEALVSPPLEATRAQLLQQATQLL